jgi:adenine-specific DNA-methyltransferase
MENINDLMPLSNDWNKERLTQLKHLFPDLFTNEGKLNIEELKKVVDPASVSETERYEFRWFGKSASKRNAYTPSNATLMFDEGRSVNPTESENIIIEGENLEALKLLSDSYREQVKCIYIDPPYNTGKDFVYSDNYTEDKKPYWEQTGVTENGLKIDTNNDTEGRYHSNWLNMMFSRLLIARALLKPDGVIFISIDDNEVHNLRKLCDEVFGSECFIADVVVVNNFKGRNDKKYIATAHERLLMYVKSDEFEESGLELPQERLKEFDKEDGIGKYRNLGLRKRGGADTRILRPKMYFPIYINPKTNEVALEKDKDFSIEIFPKKSDGTEGCWRWGFNTVLQRLEFLEGLTVNNEVGHDIFEKDYLETNGEIRRIKPKSVMIGSNYSTDGATKSFRALFDAPVFNNPKSVHFLKDLMSYCTNFDTNDLVLDFFGGSGSTGQAVSELNQDDEGNRKFILVQIPEATTVNSEAYKAGYKKISDITIERNKRVVEKIIEEKKRQQPDLFTNGHKEDAIKGLGFKVFKLVKSNFPRVEWAPDVDKTDEENIALLKKYISDKEAQLVTPFNRDELLTEILLKNGFQLNYKAAKQDQFKQNEILLATDGIKETLICLDINVEADTVEYFKKHTDKKFICLERALDTTKKYNLKHYLGDLFNAF